MSIRYVACRVKVKRLIIRLDCILDRYEAQAWVMSIGPATGGICRRHLVAYCHTS